MYPVHVSLRVGHRRRNRKHRRVVVRTYREHVSLRDGLRRRSNHNVFSRRRRRKLTSLTTGRVEERVREAAKKEKARNSFSLQRGEMVIEDAQLRRGGFVAAKLSQR